MMRLFLGIDGGQSGTTALIGDGTGRVLGVGKAGPCNHARASEGRRKFFSAVSASLTAACAVAGLSEAPVFAAACLGFSGGPEDKDDLAREIVQAERYLVTHDAFIALAGATAGAPGIIVIAGTGSIAFGRNAAGLTARAGGWGYLFGDEGGAFDLVRQALRAVLRDEEGWGTRTALRETLIEAGGARDANDLLHRFYTDEYPRDHVATFAKLVDDAARGGDKVASDILGSAAQALATIAAAVRRQLFDAGSAVDVRYSGGVFASEPLLARFRMLVELEDGNRVAAPRYGPAEGALLEAYRIGGVTCELREQ
jgi:N-acetylglucosamine kinase-like BadF-type ATPase